MTTNNAVNVSLSGQTGTGSFAGSTSPTFVTPALGTPASGNLSSCTNYPFSALTGSISAAQLIAMGNSGVSAIGNTTYDLTTASGTLTITGLAFQPSLVIFLAGVNSTSIASWGFDNGTTRMGIGYNSTGAVFVVDQGSCLDLVASSGNTQTAVISSFTSDGFVLTFTKVGTPSGTARIGYLAFK